MLRTAQSPTMVSQWLLVSLTLGEGNPLLKTLTGNICANVKLGTQKLISLPSENKKEELDIPILGKSSPLSSAGYVRVYLTLADSEHLRATGRAYPLSCRLAIFHSDAFGILHLFLGAALHTICLHIQASSLILL